MKNKMGTGAKDTIFALYSPQAEVSGFSVMIGAVKPTVLIVNDDQLLALLARALQQWPLYRTLEYNGASTLYRLPSELKLWCEGCKLESYWATKFGQYDSDATGFGSRSYQCRNCGKRTFKFYFYWQQKGSPSVFLKVGQYPAPEERVGEALTQMLDEDDLKLYKNGLRMRNFNMGIAAVAYLRRVLENRMNDMLDVLHEAAVLHNADGKLLARLAEVKAEKRFSFKADYAGDLLPSNLRPPGKPNPMAILHELASAGLHGDSDEECVEVFDACRATFEHVFAKMKIELDEAKQYVKSIDALVRKKAAKATEAMSAPDSLPTPPGETS